MDTKNIVNFLLKNLPRAKLVSNNTEINCRCMFCPDSKNPSHAHFYISVPSNNNPIFFHCKKCQSAGVLTHKTLLEWNLFDQNVSIDLINYNKGAFNGCTYNLSQDIYNINNMYISDTKKSEIKLKYINNRLGLNLDYNDIINSKIVLNIKDLLNTNNITQFTRDINIINQLDEYFIGFLSYDNSFLNCRRIIKEGTVYKTIDKRYINYNIFNKVDNTSNYYTLPNNIDISKPVKICIAEGPFDTLSIRYNLLKSSDNIVYSTVQGNNYLGCIRHFLNVLSVPNIEIHVYLDMDVSDRVIPHLINNLAVYNMKTYIHWNLKYKDMGVPVNKIEESIERIL